MHGICTDPGPGCSSLGGLGNVEDNVFHRPEGDSRGVALRTYDAATATWAIWWVDSRAPHGALDPPVKGKFLNGVGTFHSDGEIGGRPARARPGIPTG